MPPPAPMTWPISGPGNRRTPPLVLDRAASRELDLAAMETYGIPGIVLMENAALALLAEALDMLDERGTEPPRVLLACGPGNNGGDGWALARHLHNAGAAPVVSAVHDPRPDSDAGVNCAICRRMAIRELSPDRLDDCGPVALIVDALFGTGLDRPVKGEALHMIEWMNARSAPVLAVDLPSGFDADGGVPLGTCVRAAATVTMAGGKPGFLADGAAAWLGRVVVADIGSPRELLERFGRPLPVGGADPPPR